MEPGNGHDRLGPPPGDACGADLLDGQPRQVSGSGRWKKDPAAYLDAFMHERCQASLCRCGGRNGYALPNDRADDAVEEEPLAKGLNPGICSASRCSTGSLNAGISWDKPRTASSQS